MLPMASHGRSKRGGAIPVQYLYTAIFVLGGLLLFVGSSLWHTRSTLVSHADEVGQLNRKLRTSEGQVKQQRALVSQLEAKNRQLEGSLADATRDLRLRDADLKLLVEQKEQKEAAQRTKMIELEAQLEFEKTAVQTLNATISQMEAAHSAREADWHELSARWMQFEKELTSDNERLLAELAKHEETKNAVAEGGFAHAHTMPGEEPLARAETEFKPRTQLPPEDDFLARQRQLIQEQERLRREQERLIEERLRQEQGGAGRLEMGSMGRKGGLGGGGDWDRPAYERGQEQGLGEPLGSSGASGGHGHQGVQDAPAPDLGHSHHDAHYDEAHGGHRDWDDWDGAHRHWDDDYHPGAWDYDDYHHGDWDHHGWDDYGGHLDPLDQAWIGDSLEGDDGPWPGSHPVEGGHHHGHDHLHAPHHGEQLYGAAGGAGPEAAAAETGGRLPVLGRDEDPPVLGRGVPPPVLGRDDNPPVLGRDEGLPVLGRDEGLPVLGKDGNPPVLGRDEGLPVLGRDVNPPVLGRDNTPPVLGREEIPVLGRDPARAERRGEDAHGGGGRPEGMSRWQRMQEAAMPGRYRHG